MFQYPSQSKNLNAVSASVKLAFNTFEIFPKLFRLLNLHSSFSFFHCPFVVDIVKSSPPLESIYKVTVLTRRRLIIQLYSLLWFRNTIAALLHRYTHTMSIFWRKIFSKNTVKETIFYYRIQSGE